MILGLLVELDCANARVVFILLLVVGQEVEDEAIVWDEMIMRLRMIRGV